MSAVPGAPPSAWADSPLLRAPAYARMLVARIGALCLAELQRLRHDRSELYTRAIQPALWLVIFGETFTRLHAIPTGNLPFIDFLAVLVLSALLGVALTTDPLRLAGAAGAVWLAAAFFSCLSMSIAGIVLKRERLMGIGQAIMMPLFFASNALYPIALMPAWLQAISKVNPLSYEVEALRGLLIGTAARLPLDFAVTAGWAVLGVACAGALLPRLTR